LFAPQPHRSRLFCGLWHWHLGVPRTRLPGDHRASPSRHLLMYLLLNYTSSRHSQLLAVKLAHRASERDNAYSEDPPGETMYAIESATRLKSEIVWVNIIARRCQNGGNTQIRRCVRPQCSFTLLPARRRYRSGAREKNSSSRRAYCTCLRPGMTTSATLANDRGDEVRNNSWANQ
jgi:hypothetical protein